jgi:ABC-type multidrug transport system ATPase subunit
MSAAVAHPATVPLPLALEADGLAHRYGRRRGLDPLSFRLAAPGAVTLVGPNGSGKSTLLRILAGLLRPTAGSATMRLGGETVAPPARRLRVGFAAPELAFYDELSVRENLVFAAEARGLEGAHAAVDVALERVGLGSRARDLVPELSSGMKQRLRLAFALLGRPSLVLLDEPGTHLDDEGRATVARLVAEQAQAGLVIVATNDEREMRLGAQRIELHRRGLGDPA